MNSLSRSLLLTVLISLSSGLVHAQTAAPAASTAKDDDKEGTTVMGDRESPIGLLIAPWREATPEKDLDRPVRFLQEDLIPLDAEVFRRQLEYYNTISAHLKSRGVPGYADPVAVSPLAATVPATTPAPASAPAPAQ